MECKHGEVSDKRVCGNTLNERIKAVTSILKGKASDVTIVFVRKSISTRFEVQRTNVGPNPSSRQS